MSDLKKPVQMNIYLIKADSLDYEAYDSAVVIAETEEEARQTHPSGDGFDLSLERLDRAWPKHKSQVKATFIGIACDGATPGVVCASHTG